jgi:Leucine-rich repeat (LRR) protein
MNILRRLLVVFFVFSIVFNCKTEEEEPPPSGNNSNTEDVVENQRLEKVLTKATQATAIKIFVYDKDNLPIQGVSVQIGVSATLPTNSDGIVFSENITLNKEYATISFTKSGYVDLIKTIVPSTNGVTEVSVKMIASTTTTKSLTFDSSVESKVVPFAGAEIIFPANSLFNVNSRKNYSGTVNLKANYFNPSDADFSMKSSGSFFGLNSSETIVPMTISFGVIEVLLTDSNGNPLNIKKGSRATLKIPAPSGSPASVALWHFNKKYGIWVQVGTANKEGNLYVGEVNYFSSYCLASTSNNVANVTVTLKHGNNLLSGQKVDLFLNGKSISNGFTDNMGKISFLKLAANEPYKIKIYSGCADPTEEDLAPIVVGENDKTIDISDHVNTKLFLIKGELKNCPNQKLTNKVFAFSKLYNGIKRFYTIKSDSNGEFTHFVNECSNLVPIKTKYTSSLLIKESGDKTYTADVNSLQTDGSLDLILNSCTGINDALLDDADILQFNDPDFKQYLINKYFSPKTEITFAMAKTRNKIVIQGPISSIDNVDELVHFINLDSLEITGSKLTKLPDDLDNLTKLKSLVIMQNNSINSEIPSEIGELPLLENLQIEFNKFIGKIPEFSPSMTKLKNLSIQVNDKLTSPTIPTSIGNLVGLESLNLNGNILSGVIPSTIGNLTKLKSLYLGNNLLTGEIPPSIGNLNLATSIDLSNNKLTSIPATIGNATSLQYLSLATNELSGSIPSEIGNLKNLTNLLLSVNKFSGGIPNFENLDNLLTLTLNGNMLTGSIPGTIKNMAKVQVITLNNNQLTGDIPQFPSTLSGFNLSSNAGLKGKTNEAKLCVFGQKYGTKIIVDTSIGGTQIENNCPEDPKP